MGLRLLARHPRLTRAAEEILQYSLTRIIESDELDQTQFTQPALFVVNALGYLEWQDKVGDTPKFAAGHSLGEYNALHAAGVFDFETGVRLVAERGRRMAAAGEGAMAAVLGWTSAELREALGRVDGQHVDIANDNSPQQQVIAGPAAEIARVGGALRAMGAKVVELRVRAAFHSRYMREAAELFGRTLATVEFLRPEFSVISNVEARPYVSDRVGELLMRQITAPVRWTESIMTMLDAGVRRFEELGPTPTLTKMIEQTRAVYSERVRGVGQAGRSTGSERSLDIAVPDPKLLGSADFRRRYGLRYAYLAGAMYKGIASSRLVVRMAKAGMLGFLGTGGLGLARIDDELQAIRAATRPGEAWGANLLASVERPELEEQIVDLYLRRGVEVVEAAAYTQISRALVRYRVGGLRIRPDGGIEALHRVIAKISRPEVARAFLSPPPPMLVAELVREGAITGEQARAAERVPVADDLCVEADSGGHTDRGVALVLLPRMLKLRNELVAAHGYTQKVGLGAAGGIGTPAAAAAAFLMGADFVLTGSINQCTVEAMTSDAVKDLLASIDIQDITCAPAGDMFELGAKVQVVRKGTLFPARANRLYGLYQHHESLDELAPHVRRQLEGKYFGRSIDEVWSETRRYYERVDPKVIDRAERSAKKQMALVFRWYFVHSNRIALAGDPNKRHDYQIHCGPALGAFNEWVAGTEFEDWRRRHVDDIALLLLRGTAAFLGDGLARFSEPRAVGSEPFFSGGVG